MADVTGALHHEFGGKTYTLRATMGVLAKLQARHGGDFMSKFDQESIRKNPPLALMIDVVTLSLIKGMGMPEGEAADLADDMLTGSPDLAVILLASAFPDAKANVGNGQAVDPAAKAA
jgi:hypothetical protein